MSLSLPDETTVGTMADRVLRTLLGSRRVELNRVNGAVTKVTTDTAVVFDYDIGGWGRGTIVEIDQEAFYVLSTVTATKTATCVRAQLGTDAAAHVDDSMARVNPVWLRQDVSDALKAEIRELNGTGLRGYDTVELTFAASTAQYDLAGVDAEVHGIHDVRWEDSDGDGATHRAKYRFVTDVDVEDFPSGYAVQILEGGEANKPVRVTYVRAFSDFEGESDELVGDCGVPAYAHDALRYGAAYRLAIQQEAARVDISAQPGSRRADEVPVTSNARLVEQLREMRERSLARAIARQYRTYPPRMRA